MRQRGIDLEPELETLEDVKREVHSCLMTYQKGLENMIQNGRGIKFSRHREYDEEK